MVKKYFFILFIVNALILPVAYAAVTWHSGSGYQFGNTTIVVSSVLPSKHGSHYYGPQNLFRDDSKQAWCTSYRQDRQPWVKLQFEFPTKFQRFFVLNGYQKNFKNNYRAKRILITANNFSQIITLRDTPKEQTLTLKRPIKSLWIKLTILDNYPSQKYDDFCLTGLTMDLEQFNY